MEYQAQELLPIVTRLTEKYTSKESTSVSYETARQLMAAVVYCIDENQKEGKENALAKGQMPSAQLMYDRGCQIVTKKVHRAKEIYDSLIEGFEDYGCENYKSTIIEGIPQFFMRYDAMFHPQDHLLTLDYPCMGRKSGECGIDLILTYLEGIQKEKAFLDCFPRAAVIRILEKISPEYQELYFDNICEPVLQQAVRCMIAEVPLKDLALKEDAFVEIKLFFDGDEKERIEKKVEQLTEVLMSHLGLDAKYFIDNYLNKTSVVIANYPLETTSSTSGNEAPVI